MAKRSERNLMSKKVNRSKRKDPAHGTIEEAFSSVTLKDRHGNIIMQNGVVVAPEPDLPDPAEEAEFEDWKQAFKQGPDNPRIEIGTTVIATGENYKPENFSVQRRSDDGGSAAD